MSRTTDPASPKPTARAYASASTGCRGHGRAAAGSGLAIVDEIARVHRAEFTIQAGSGGRGTRMTLRFPRPRL